MLNKKGSARPPDFSRLDGHKNTKNENMANIEKRIAKNGKVSYRVKVRLKGYPAQSETFPNLSMAKNWATRMEARIKEGLHLTVIESKRHTLAELIDLYDRRILSARSNNSRYPRSHLRVWRELMGDYSLASITPALIIKTRERIADIETNNKKKSQSTLNRYLAALSVVLSYAVRELEWLEVNPVSKVSKLPEPRGRVRYLSDTEREKLLYAAKESKNPYIYPVILLGITTGARKMEIMGLRWSDVDLFAQRAVLHDTKNGERRGLPLVEPALTELKKLYATRRKSEFVFPSRDGMQPFDIKRGWDAVINAAGIEDFHFHDLRHTCASYLAMNGATMGEIAAVLGHKTLQMTKRYAHLSDEHSQSVVEKMTTKIFGGQ